MNGLTGWKRALWTLGIVGLWGLLSSLMVFEWDVFEMDASDWQTVVVAVIASVGTFATNWLAPWIPQYGPHKKGH